MIISQRVFAEMCGVSPPAISGMINRGKLVSINRKIDTEMPENKTYLAKKTLEIELKKTLLSIDPIETRSEFYKKNADKRREYQREYNREYQQKNADKIREYHIKWNQKPESKTLEHIKRIRKKTGAKIYRRDLDDATFQAIHATHMIEREMKNITKANKTLDNTVKSADNTGNSIGGN